MADDRSLSSPDGRTRVLQVLGPSTGGIRRHVAALTDGLLERGWAVEVAGPVGVMDGLRTLDHALPISRDPRLAARSLRSLRGLARSCDVVHAHGLTAGWTVSLLPRRPPLVITVHNLVLDEAEGRLAPVLRRIEDRIPSRADAVIAISEQVARRFTGLRGADRVTVVPPVGLTSAAERGADIRRELGAGPDAPLLVLVGRLHPQKDIGSLLEATVVLRRHHPGVVVAVAGAGPERDALLRRAAELGVDDAVHFLGARDDVANLMSAANVVVMCSIWESYGFVVSEALALGRPLVATAVGPVPDLVIDGATGRLVPPSAPEALAAAIGDLLEDPELAARLGSAGAQHVATKLAPAALIDRVAAIYHDVLEGR